MAAGVLTNRARDFGDDADVPGGGNGGGHEGAVPRRAYITGMTIALGAVLMFFMAMVSAYIVRKNMPGNGWLPLSVFPRILWLDTLVLVASSFTLARARSFLLAGRGAAFRRLWIITIGLGALFLAGQWIACEQLAAAGVYLATNPSSSFFFVFTAAHGVHILGGLAALLCVICLRKPKIDRGVATEVVAMYWHFMDGLWLFLFLLLLSGKR